MIEQIISTDRTLYAVLMKDGRPYHKLVLGFALTGIGEVHPLIAVGTRIDIPKNFIEFTYEGLGIESAED